MRVTKKKKKSSYLSKRSRHVFCILSATYACHDASHWSFAHKLNVTDTERKNKSIDMRNTSKKANVFFLDFFSKSSHSRDVASKNQDVKKNDKKRVTFL